MSNQQQHESWERAVQEAIRSLRFGSVVVTMHEGKVTQIEKREKIRPEESRRHEALVPNQTEKPTLNGRPS
ncbi:MAG: putative small protein [Fibrobacteria bacterium]|jgi:hypothetical protein|nr:putative small protein [Fibrobacteria bacterium]